MSRTHKVMLLPREAWSYAILLVILFAIASVAAYDTISHIQTLLPAEQGGIIAARIIALSLGFMAIAGAFGLWAIKMSAGAESRRRIGRLIDAMDYISDGLLALDAKGRISGFNPAVAALSGATMEHHRHLRDIFPCLSIEDGETLLKSSMPHEMERQISDDAATRTLRFRSQPAEGIILLLVSDVTAEESQRQRNRMIARLQLVGELARGVAHDFNTILCSISGHAALLPRLAPQSREAQQSMNAIARNADRGVVLAAHLLQLSQPGISSLPSLAVGDHLQMSARALRDTLSEGWQVTVTATDIPPIGLTGMQLEQIVTNLGLIASDAIEEPGAISITCAPPGGAGLCNVGPAYAGVICIQATPTATAASAATAVNPDEREAGVIQSVVRSMVDEAGGGLDCLSTGNGVPIFRIRLPRGGVVAYAHGTNAYLPLDLGAYIRGWRILLAVPPGQQTVLEKVLRDQQAQVERVDNIASALSRVEDGQQLNSAILDERTLGTEFRGLLRAILKLRPTLGVCVLCADPEQPDAVLKTDVSFVAGNDHPERIVRAMIEARGQAARRNR